MPSGVLETKRQSENEYRGYCGKGRPSADGPKMEKAVIKGVEMMQATSGQWLDLARQGQDGLGGTREVDWDQGVPSSLYPGHCA